MTSNSSLLDQIVEAGAGRTEDRPRGPEDTMVTDSAGIVWCITDPVTGRAERVTPYARKSALAKRAGEDVRYFPPANTVGSFEDRASVLSAIAADPCASMMLVRLIARSGDRDTSFNELAREYPHIPEPARNRVIDAWMVIKETKP